jgi:exonuclease SbcC
MRLHKLTVTAFGPFAGTEVVDFDRLADGGLFLMHGPTGAGKTSVLDAVCFALYGSVPGTRRAAGGRLRSDHAAETVAPRVVCELSVGGRRLEVTRSPEWRRPKRRGSGTTREPARALLRELRDGEWVAVTQRADEAGDLLQRLLGLGVDQFTKLVLLPQGEFAAFLRATADDRRTMLQRLFGTERFDDVEKWLAERRRELARDVVAAAAETRRLAARAAEAAAALGDDDREGHEGPDDDLAVPQESDPETTAEAVERLARVAAAARKSAARRHRQAVTAHAAAREARAAADDAVARRVRRHALEAERQDLERAAPAQAARRERLAAAAAADVLAPLVGGLAAARERSAAAAAGETAAGEAALALGERPDPDPKRLEKRIAALREQVGALGEALRAETELRRVDREHGEQSARVSAAAAARDREQAAVAALAERERELADRLAAAERLGETLADREADVDRARGVAEAVLHRDALAAEVAELADAERAAVDAHQRAQEHALDLRERRLAGMAAELAAGLADGEACPVCGADEHPHPAVAAAPRVTEAEEAEARAAVTAAQAARDEATSASADAAKRLAAAAARAGDADAASAATALRAAVDAQEQATAAVRRTTTLAAQAAEAARDRAGAEARHAAALAALESAVEALGELHGRRETLRAQVDAARGDDADVATRHARLGAQGEALGALRDALREVDDAARAVTDATTALERAAAAAGFATLDAALAAVLTGADREALARAAEAHDAALARTATLLAELGAPDQPDHDAPLPDLDALAARQREAANAEEHAAGRVAVTARAAESLRDLARVLGRHALATAPLRERYAVLDAVSRCADGTGGDNQLRMRLSAYVLAARLEEVAAAATDRLLAMSGGRYTLVHTDDLVGGRARSGLGLAVVDSWTGRRRDTASLSGGETFYASLALALGLADVVRAEAGGTSIETMLVDEGFGSLDPETLDEVMDTLDGLRSGGRAVGLVSHVSDLRDRIPVQLEIVKTRTGSKIRTPVGAIAV